MKIKILVYAFLISATFLFVSGQEFRKGPIVVCPADPNSYDTRVPFRPATMHLAHDHNHGDIARPATRQTNSNFVVNYNGFTPEAQAAFQFAVDIWATLLTSEVDIIVNANFADLGAGVLGSAGPSYLVRDFPNAPSDTTFYPIALAEKIAGQELNLEGEPEINCSFSSTFNWYYGTDGETPGGQSDFVTVVLHELGHGLGFTGARGYDTNTGIGNWDHFDNKTSVYNLFATLVDGSKYIDLPNNSIQVGNALTGGNLFFDGPLAVEALGERPELYAPASFAGGSTFAHLDEATFPAGDPNSLMSPQIGSGESIFDPGVSLDIFADMGWFITTLDHEVQKRVIGNLVDDIFVEVELRSDTNIVSNDLKVVYSTDDFQSTTEISLSEGAMNMYSANIPNPGSNATIKYYFEGIEDGLGRTVTSPSNVPSNFYQVDVINQSTQSVPFALTDNGDFEAGAAGFYSIPLIGDVNQWELGTPGSQLTSSNSPATAWKTSLSGDVIREVFSYTSALVSPNFDLSDANANYIMSFNLGMDLGFNLDNGLFDAGPLGLTMQVSTDGGVSWEQLGTKDDQTGTNWFNFQSQGTDTFFRNVFAGDAGWIFEDLASIPVTYNISSFAGNAEVAFRFVFHVEGD